MINDLDESLKQFLVEKGKLDTREIDIRFEAPDREWVGKLSRPTVNLFLYDIHENTEFRQHDWMVNRKGNNRAIKTKPVAWIDLSYLVTAWANAIEDEHRLLWHLLVVLLRFPILPSEVMQGTFAQMDHKIQTKAAQMDGPYRSLAELWGSLEVPLKPSVDYVATVPLDRATELDAPIVLAKRLRVDQRVETASPDELLQIGGRVYDRKNPERGVGAVKVSIKETGLVVTADESGHFWFPAISPGRYTFSVLTEDGKEVTREVTLPEEIADIPI